MRKLFLHIVLLCIACSIFAQKIPSGLVKRADKHLQNYEYADAAKYYERILEKSANYEYAKLQLIKCYNKLDLNEKSLPLYASVVRSGSNSADTSFKIDYAQSLMQNGNYDRATTILQEVLSNSPENRIAKNLLTGLNDLNSFYMDSARYKIQAVSFNSEQSDYAPSLYQGGVVFLSNRTDFQLIKDVNSWDNLGYHEQYYMPDSDSAQLEKFDKHFNIKFNRGPVFFYNQDSSAVFTANSKAKSDDGSFKLQLFETHKLKNGNWRKPSPLAINQQKYNFLSPFVTSHSDTLYFASDMPGGFGELDIYMSIRKDSIWSEPVNLGASVNTSKNELYPHRQNRTFYFSSNGHYGLGGLDLYRIDNLTEEIVNLGVPVNSRHDDFALVLDTANSGYFSSSRNEGMGMDDIYEITITKPSNEILIVDFIDEETGEPIEGVGLEGLMDNDSFDFDPIKLNEQQIQLRLPLRHIFKLSFNKPGYISKDINYEPLESDRSQVNLTVKMLKQLVVSETVIDVSNGTPLDSVEIVFTHANNEKIDTLSTNEKGFFNLIADRETDYQVFLKRNGYFNYSKTVTTRPDSLGLILFNLSMEKIDLNKGIEIADIYFELGSVELTSGSKKNLDSLVTLMNENPKLTIELGSHTDATGSSLFNLNISERRAIAVANYLSEKGIDAIRLIAKGYGESELLNGCSDGVPCSKEQHDTNRRLEFKVLSY